MSEKKKHKVFVQGAISPQFIADSIAKHSSKTSIGAHDIFLVHDVGDNRNEDDSDNGVLALKRKWTHRCIEYLAESRKYTFS